MARNTPANDRYRLRLAGLAESHTDGKDSGTNSGERQVAAALSPL